jgi:2-dehydro-3-deoxygalactonokinase
MGWNEGFIAVDWGTTNRRAYLIGPGGERQGEMEDDLGILSVAKGGFGEAVATLTERLGDRPLLMAGMIGSNRGWAEMQIVGAVGAGLVPPDSIVCHPGTHNKWVRLEAGRIVAFRTVMTGEIFNLLKSHSILSDLLAAAVRPDSAFESGVRHGLDHDDLTAELFSVRARTLLGKSARQEAACYASGLLIGADLRFGLLFVGKGEIMVMGRPDLTELYAAALAIAGRAVREVDGEEAFVAGAIHLAELLQ